MRKKIPSIPINDFGGEVDKGIVIEKIAFDDLPDLQTWDQPERHDRHSFFLIEKGTVAIEIDFKKYQIQSPSVMYMHPNQVHRILSFKNVTVTSWAINNENLTPDYLKLLEDLTPIKPLPISKETFGLFSEAVSLCMKFAAREQDKLYHSLVKDCCNALVALVISQYIDRSPRASISRFEMVTKAFREAVEKHFTGLKRPAEYARKLNISTAYLNECVKNTTGYPVSYHIQQRIILEAKRILYHTDKSVKEIATLLGYDDHSYFSRLFIKAAGLTALAFRNKNRD